MHQSDKDSFRWYLKLLKQNLHTTQVTRHSDLLYFKSDSEKSYKVIKFSETEQESQENHYSNNSSQENFS